jgi:acyl carrier protein
MGEMFMNRRADPASEDAMTSPTTRPDAPVSTALRNRIRTAIVQAVADLRLCEPSEVEKNPRIADDLEVDSLGLLSVVVALDRATGVRTQALKELDLFFSAEHRSGPPLWDVKHDLTELFAELGLPTPPFAQVTSPKELLTIDVMTGLVVRNMRDGEDAADLRRAEYERFQKRWGPFAEAVRSLLAIAELFALVWSIIKRCWKR